MRPTTAYRLLEAASAGVPFPASQVSQPWLREDDVGIRSYDPDRITWPWTSNYKSPQAAVMRFYGPQGLHWVHDGVSVGKSKFRRDAWMTASVGSCNLDLTGLQVIYDEVVSQRRKMLQDWAGSLRS